MLGLVIIISTSAIRLLPHKDAVKKKNIMMKAYLETNETLSDILPATHELLHCNIASCEGGLKNAVCKGFVTAKRFWIHADTQMKHVINYYINSRNFLAFCLRSIV